ncbi:glycosyltransferase family 4 protein [Roseateles sp.]|uniref:glycosyltransferase family 4 protein n=1 Tax=Roseateles sp. TaxID=1971397 RepID=UPI003BA7E0C6
MKIAFDSQIFVAQRFGGISRYFASLSSQLAQLPGVVARIDAIINMNDHLQSLAGSVPSGRHIRFRSSLRHLLFTLNGAWSTVRCITHPVDVLHRTYYYRQSPTGRARLSVVSVFDMIHEKFGASYSAADRERVITAKRRAVLSADLVLCISNSTRADLLAAHPVDPAKVFVTHLGYDPLPPLVVSPIAPDGQRRYLLYVGSRTRYKNFDRLIEAYGSSPQLVSEFDLLCFGGGSWTPSEQLAIARLGVKGRVHHRAGDDQALAQAYRGAAMFVYPSLYEGFGIPPLEAMSVGCPVACSSVSSIPEVVGPAGAYFDPSDVSSIRKCLEMHLCSADRMAKLVEAGNNRCRAFSWERCAQETLALYGKGLGR